MCYFFILNNSDPFDPDLKNFYSKLHLGLLFVKYLIAELSKHQTIFRTKF